MYGIYIIIINNLNYIYGEFIEKSNNLEIRYIHIPLSKNSKNRKTKYPHSLSGI